MPNLGQFLERVLSNSEIPQGWSLQRLDDVANRGTGHTPDRKIPEYWYGGIKWVSLADSHRLDRIYIHDTEYTISEQGIENSSAVKHPPGVVILSRDAGVGKSAITASEMAVSQHFIAWKCGSNLYNLYLYYWLQFMKTEFERVAVGSTIKTIGLPYFEKLTILLPPPAEQRKIAAILSTWDEAITLTEQLIDALQRRKQALMQLLLTGAVRFPAFDGEWASTQVGEFMARNGRQLNPLELENDLPCVELEHISQETGRILGYTSAMGQKSTKNYFEAGQILFGKLRPYLRKFAQPNFEGVASSEIWVLSGKNGKCLNDFLFYIVQSNDFINAANATSGTKMPRADWAFVAEFEFAIPAIQEQKAIAQFLQTYDEHMEILGKILGELRVQKRGLMQQLLTGAVRVQVED